MNGPLDWRIPIVDKAGRPSPEFQRRLTESTTTVLSPQPGYIYRLEPSAAGASSTFTVTAGSATDSTGKYVITLPTTWTKTMSAWAVGSGNGALDTSTVATFTWYYIYLIAKSDGTSPDILISTSSTAPTMPNTYTLFRRIGVMITDGSSKFLGFFQKNNTVVLNTAFSILSGSVIGTSAVLQGVLAPPSITTQAVGQITIIDAGVSTAGLVTSPMSADVVPGAIPGNFTVANGGTASGIGAARWFAYTNTSQQVRIRVSSGTASVYLVSTGWEDPR